MCQITLSPQAEEKLNLIQAEAQRRQGKTLDPNELISEILINFAQEWQEDMEAIREYESGNVENPLHT